MAKKTYVSPGIMLLAAGDPGGNFGDQYSPNKDSSLGAKGYQFDEFDDFNDDEFTSQW